MNDNKQQKVSGSWTAKGLTLHGMIISDEELKRAARTLNGKPVKDVKGKIIGSVLWAEWNDEKKCIEWMAELEGESE